MERQFENFAIFGVLGSGIPNMYISTRNLAQRSAKFHDNLRRGKKPQNRYLSKFNTGATVGGKKENKYGNVK